MQRAAKYKPGYCFFFYQHPCITSVKLLFTGVWYERILLVRTTNASRFMCELLYKVVSTLQKNTYNSLSPDSVPFIFFVQFGLTFSVGSPTWYLHSLGWRQKMISFWLNKYFHIRQLPRDFLLSRNYIISNTALRVLSFLCPCCELVSLLTNLKWDFHLNSRHVNQEINLLGSRRRMSQ